MKLVKAEEAATCEAYKEHHVTADVAEAHPEWFRTWRVASGGLAAHNKDGGRFIVADRDKEEWQHGDDSTPHVLIADCYPDSADDYGLPEDYKANAALIVRAVNQHNRLVDALRAALDSWYAKASNIERLEPTWVTMARAALHEADATNEVEA